MPRPAKSLNRPPESIEEIGLELHVISNALAELLALLRGHVDRDGNLIPASTPTQQEGHAHVDARRARAAAAAKRAGKTYAEWLGMWGYPREDCPPEMRKVKWGGRPRGSKNRARTG